MRQAAKEYVDMLCRPVHTRSSASVPGSTDDAAPAGDLSTASTLGVAAAAADAGAIAAATADAARDLLLLIAYLSHVRTAGGWAPGDVHWSVLIKDVAPKVRGRGRTYYLGLGAYLGYVCTAGWWAPGDAYRADIRQECAVEAARQVARLHIDIVAQKPRVHALVQATQRSVACLSFLMCVVLLGEVAPLPSYSIAALAPLWSTCLSAWHLAGPDHIILRLCHLLAFAGKQAEAVLRAALVASWLAATPAARTHTRAGDPAALIGGLQLDDAGGRSLAPEAAPVAREVGVLGGTFLNWEHGPQGSITAAGALTARHGAQQPRDAGATLFDLHPTWHVTTVRRVCCAALSALA